MGVHTRMTTLTDCVLELSPIVMKSCAGNNSITLIMIMILDQVVEGIE